RSHSASTARTERPSSCASRPTVARSVQCSHRSLIDLRRAFLVLRSAFKARTERSTLAQRVQRPHSAFMGLRNAFIARTEGSKVGARRLSAARGRRFLHTFLPVIRD